MKYFRSRLFGCVKVLELTYHNGCTAIQVVAEDDEDDYVATLSINLPEYVHCLRNGEFFAKTWAENEEIANEALVARVLIDTGGRVSTPLGSISIWRCR